jgi:glycosyltransferase involved in cell wall biosynthesis
MNVRLYGRIMGHGSHAQVTRGFRETLEVAGLLSGVVALDILGLDEQLMGQLRSSGDPAVEHGVLTGALEFMDQLTRAKHARRWVMVAPNSNCLPRPIEQMLNDIATDVLVPSDWAADMLKELTDKPIHVVPHGVHEGFSRSAAQRERLENDYNAQQFRVLHFSTSERQRKGTFELLCAWRALMKCGRLPKLAELFLVLDYSAQLRLAERLVDEDMDVPGLKVVTRLDAAPQAMADVLRQAHVVCQPSRAEAFGIIPLEALACGTPIVATACTGHKQYLSHLGVPGFVVVTHYELGPIDDGPAAVAPTVHPEAIEAALAVAYDNWRDLSGLAFDAAPRVAVDWSWRRQLAPWLEQLR